jgi:hypothetical protein
MKSGQHAITLIACVNCRNERQLFGFVGQQTFDFEYWSLSSFAQWGIRPHFIILGIRFPSTDRIATSIGSVGGLFQSGAKFGAGASAANFSRILISE